MRGMFPVSRKYCAINLTDSREADFKRIGVGAIYEYGHQNHPKSFSPTNFFELLFCTRDLIPPPTIFNVIIYDLFYATSKMWWAWLKTKDRDMIR